ncbi:MAG: hypothetical protein ACI81R_001924 [Bradymonadia bacterium]|jgi:hypothetical protein
MGTRVTLRQVTNTLTFSVICLLSSSVFAQGTEVGNVNIEASLKLETGWDSNLFSSSDSDAREPGLLLNITPAIRVTTIDPELVALDSGVGFNWGQYLGDEDERGQSGESIAFDLALQFNPNGVISITPSDQLTRATRAGFSRGSEPFQSTDNTFELALGFHPGGALRTSRIGFTAELAGFHRLWRYDELSSLNKNGIGGRLELKYNFLPKTGAFLSANIMSLRNEQNQPNFGSVVVANADSTPFRITAGLTGLLLPRMSILVAAGYGGSSYRAGSVGGASQGALPANIGTYLLQADLTAHVNPNTTFGLGYLHNYDEGVVENGYEFHRASLGGDSSLGMLSFGAEAYLQRNLFADTVDNTVGGETCSGDRRQETAVGGDANVGLNPLDWFSTGIRYSVENRDSNCQTVSAADVNGQIAPAADAGYIRHRAFLFVEFRN